MVNEKLASVKLFRFDPEVDTEPRYDSFKVPYEGRTILDVLRHIYENFDSTLAFRWACTGGFCRSCIVLVNGRPALACQRPAEVKMRLEPHPKFKIMKDLVVNLSKPK